MLSVPGPIRAISCSDRLTKAVGELVRPRRRIAVIHAAVAFCFKWQDEVHATIVKAAASNGIGLICNIFRLQRYAAAASFTRPACLARGETVREDDGEAARLSSRAGNGENGGKTVREDDG